MKSCASFGKFFTKIVVVFIASHTGTKFVHGVLEIAPGVLDRKYGALVVSQVNADWIPEIATTTDCHIVFVAPAIPT